MIKAILFDLDDTLYEERQYFCSGFYAVGKELERRGVNSANRIASLLMYILDKEGRENIFQKAAEQAAFSDKLIPEIVRLFRSHQPSISLSKDAVCVLSKLKKNYKLGCVTDGNIQIQNQKIHALGLRSYFSAIVITDELGNEYRKPHSIPFIRCCQMLGVCTKESVFVGDSVERDVVGARGVGMKAILVVEHKKYKENDIISDIYGQSVVTVNSLVELEPLLTSTGSWE